MLTRCKIRVQNMHSTLHVYEKRDGKIERAKKLVSECVCFKADEKGRSITEVFELLQLCYYAGLGLGYEIFEFEDRYTRTHLIWLLEHGAEAWCLNLSMIIEKEYWDVIFLLEKKQVYRDWNIAAEIARCLLTYIHSSTLSIVLLYYKPNFWNG